jgi:DNA (cytosine-5)-methyltransferase 1
LLTYHDSTTPGKNDEENTFALLTVEAWLQKVKPRTFSLEQAPGLLQLAKHRKYFRKLINGIISSGYQVRWGIQNHAWLGLPQHRRRLIIVGSKGTFPLPPFPAATHGPPGSSLRPYVTIADALHPLKSRQVRFPDDPYHQPKSMRPLNRPPINPHANLAKVVTTSGKENAHHSGKRASTVRELAAFQGFPLDFHFTGSTRTATKQCGNAWPPGSNQFYFRVWAAHHEAYNNGMIDDEEEVLDLYDVLAQKKYMPIPFDLEADMPGFIYLPNITRTIPPRYPLSVWERNAPQQRAR